MMVIDVARAVSGTWADVKRLARECTAGSLSWSRGNSAPAAQIIAAAVGLAGPLAAGMLAGRPEIGILPAMGALASSSAGVGNTRREQFSSLGYTLLSGSTAMLAGAGLASCGRTAFFLLPFIAGMIGLVGSISRPLARATTHFILYCIIAMHVDINGLSPVKLMLLFLMGAGWYTCIAFVLTVFLHRFRSQKHGQPALPTIYPANLLLRRWMRNLKSLSGWRYPLRLTLCLAAGESFEWIWPHHHGYWVFITVVIVLQRDTQSMPAKIFQRAAGTFIGVLVAGLIWIGPLPVWAAIGLIGLFGAGRVVLKQANYTAYAVVMTILIVILLDFGSAPSLMIFTDRFAATFFGCVIALLFGYLPWHQTQTIGQQSLSSQR